MSTRYQQARHRFVRSIKRTPRVYDLARRFSRVLGEGDPLHAFLKGAWRQIDPVRLLQIGANDGMRNDPVREFIAADPQCQCLLVEPVPQLFSELESNYAYLKGKGREVHLVNRAVGDSGSLLKLWKIKDPYLQEFPDFVQGMVSVTKANFAEFVPSHRIDEVTERVEVRSATVSEILRMVPGFVPNLVVIDVEGFERTVFEQFPFSEMEPNCVMYELCNLSRSDREAIEVILVSRGYELLDFKRDGVAVKGLDQSGLPRGA